MALLPLTSATNISFHDLQAVYAAQNTPQDVSLSNFVAGGQFLPYYTGMHLIPTSTTGGISMDSFAQRRQPGWQYRNTLVTFGGTTEPAWSYGNNDFPIGIDTSWGTSTSTYWFVRSSGFGSGTTATIMNIGGGNINAFRSGTDVHLIWASNNLGTCASGAISGANAVLTDVSGNAVRSTANVGGTNAELVTDLKALTNAMWQVVEFNGFFWAWTPQATGSGVVNIQRSGTGGPGSWAGYPLLTARPGGSFKMTKAGGRLWLHGTDGYVYSTTDPTGSWTQHVNLRTLTGNFYMNTVAHNNGVWIVAGQGGKMVRSTAPASDSWTLVGGPAASPYWTNNGYIERVIPYGGAAGGFLAFGTFSESQGWSPDGSTWYFGLGQHRLRNTGILSRVTSMAHYDPVLDRVYFWTQGGYYARTDGGDLQLTVTGSPRRGLSSNLQAVNNDLYSNARTDYGQTMSMWHAEWDSVNNRAAYVDGNGLKYTLDGATWTTGTFPATANQALYWKRLSDGYYYVGQIAGYFWTSPTGIDSWTQLAIQGAANVTYNQDILLSGGQYVYATTIGIYTSTVRAPTQTTDYTQRLASVNVIRLARNSVGRIAALAYGGEYGAYTMVLYTSDDNGTSWTLQAATAHSGAAGTSTYPTDLIWTGTEFIGSGYTITWPAQTVTNGWILNFGPQGTTKTVMRDTNSTAAIQNVGYDPVANIFIASGGTGSTSQIYTSRQLVTGAWTISSNGTWGILGPILWMTNTGKYLIYGRGGSSVIVGTKSS